MKTQERLEVAKFFLENMKDVIEDRRAFIYNLLAFIGFSRSVTWVLQKEFSRLQHFQEWYVKKQEEMRIDPLLSYFVEMRNVVIKEGAPQIKARRAITFSADVVLSDHLSIKLIKGDGSVETFESPPPKAFAYANPDTKEPVLIGYYFEDWPDDDVISFCEKYLEKIECIMKEAYEIVRAV